MSKISSLVRSNMTQLYFSGERSIRLLFAVFKYLRLSRLGRRIKIIVYLLAKIIRKIPILLSIPSISLSCISRILNACFRRKISLPSLRVLWKESIFFPKNLDNSLLLKTQLGIIVQKEEKLGFIRIFVLIKCSRKELSEVLMIELNGKKKLLRLFSIFVSYVRLTKTSRTANSIMLWNLS